MERLAKFALGCILSAMLICNARGQEATPGASQQDKAVLTQQNKIDLAAGVANRWLNLMDSGKYAQSWEEAAEYLRKSTLKENWPKAYNTHHLLGKKLSRKIVTAEYLTNLSGFPPGEYVRITYSSQFEYSTNVSEEVVLVFENNKWRVIAYSDR